MMTDRSNSGPVRRLSPPVSADNRKPYSRTGLKGVLGTLDLNSGDAALPTAPESPYYPFHVETPQLEAPSQNRPTDPGEGPRDVAGFPTYEQYLRIEDEYLSSLSERKQPKALISQVLFDKIFAVLQNGSEDRSSTAQFRFWVRKMFVLAYPQTSFFTSRHNNNGGGGGGLSSSSAPEPVVLHDKRPVAIREQLYEVLCYCHAMARHGGRDKTCATLRLHYSWVPKELTAKFVKACPTCTLKRSGNPDLLSQFGQVVQSQPQPQPQPSYVPQTLLSPTPVQAEPTFLFPGGPNDSPPSLSFVVGSVGCDEASVGGGGYPGYGPSIFATPDFSVYPSPTLSAGSLGPMTPSPFLPSGLFGYPAVFDPGHGSFSSVAGWDSSPLSPCVPMYVEEMRTDMAQHVVQSMSADEIIDMRARDVGMHLHLPTPKAARVMRTRVHSYGGGNEGCGNEGDRRGIDTFSGVVDTPCPVDMGNIDPVLLAEGGGYPVLTLVGPPMATMMDASADMGPCAGGTSGTGSGCEPCFRGFAGTWDTPTPVVVGSGGGTTTDSSGARYHLSPAAFPLPPPPMAMFAAPVPTMPAVVAPRAKRAILLRDINGHGQTHDADADAEEDAPEVEEEEEMVLLPGTGTGTDVDVDDTEEGDMDRDGDGDVDVDVNGENSEKTHPSHHRMPLGLPVEHTRWVSPEAWLVQSDSMDGAVAPNAVVSNVLVHPVVGLSCQ